MKLPVTGIATAALMFAADQAAKYGVTHGLKLDAMSEAYYVNPIFNLRFVANHGISLGLLRSEGDLARWGLIALTGLIAVGVAVWMFREPRRADQAALGLVLGGALGNILDRARLGYVVDFADLHFGAWQPFLVFNTGDAMITVGVLILFARAFFVRDTPLAPQAPEPSPVENYNV